MYASQTFYNWTSVSEMDGATDIVDLRLTNDDGTPKSLHNLAHPVSIRMPLFIEGKTSQKMYLTGCINIYCLNKYEVKWAFPW